jgi:DegV family protein with EDD domain
LEERDAAVVPLTIRFGDEELVDRTQLSPKEFWDRVITGQCQPETAAPAPGAFQAAFRESLQLGYDGVLCLTLSSGVSATYQAAVSAAREVAGEIPVRVFDTLAMSVAQGIIVLEALELSESGRNLDELEEAAASSRERTRLFGLVDSLDYLRRGGRIGGAAALVGSLLSIKPVVEVRNGTVELESRQRTRARSFQYLASRVLEARPLTRIAVASGAATDVEDLLTLLEEAHPTHDPVIVDLGPVVGSHTGPGSIGLALERER